MDAVERAVREAPAGLVFGNLVDFDAMYGHRNDGTGYAANLERFDERLGRLVPMLGDDDLLLLTADHGNDRPRRARTIRASSSRCWRAGPRVRPGVRSAIA